MSFTAMSYFELKHSLCFPVACLVLGLRGQSVPATSEGSLLLCVPLGQVAVAGVTSEGLWVPCSRSSRGTLKWSPCAAMPTSPPCQAHRKDNFWLF